MVIIILSGAIREEESTDSLIYNHFHLTIFEKITLLLQEYTVNSNHCFAVNSKFILLNLSMEIGLI